ncbi:hypothetical protein [Parasitella parasitica]|uniref:B30.2/SPRY domain-containing protein n=1 Tax=Parasitella parasitica TaxID=35722 RepID=A0A0B7N0E9_9FUNG|nr:hypothetical protein [Parasitella parasitica]
MSTQNTTYSSAFPPLQAFPWPYHKQPSFQHAPSPASTPSTPLSLFAALAPPKYPAYLKHTSYATLVSDQHQHLQQKKRCSSDDYNRELVEVDLRLPQYWSFNDKSRHLQVGLNGCDLAFHAQTPGPGKKELIEAASIRTNFPVRPQCGIYYYEISVISMGHDGLFAIGFCDLAHPLDKLPGASSGSLGYHGQNGHIYQQNSKGKSYGPSFAPGDVVGCGINFANNTVFFTKNGVSLGCACDDVDLSCSLYPCIGLSTQGEKIAANFGQQEYAFDIAQYIKDQQRASIDHVCHATVKETPRNKYRIDTKAQIDELILSHLIHQGYFDTAQAMKKNMEHVGNTKHQTPLSSSNDELDQETRRSIRKSLMTGHVDEAMEKTQKMYPNLLASNQDLLFQLKTQKYLDLLTDDNHHEPSCTQSFCSSDLVSSNSSDTDDETMSVHSGRSRTLSASSHDLQHQILYEEQPATFGHHSTLQVSPPPQLPVAASGRRLSWAAIAAPPSSDSHAEETQQLLNGRRRRLSSVSNYSRRDSYSSSLSLNEEDEASKTMAVVRKAIHYGQQLQEEYKNTQYWVELMEMFALLSFADPRSSPMSHLLDASRRDSVASDLNNAIQEACILAYRHRAMNSNLELVLKQAIVSGKELALAGHGKASLMHIQNQVVSGN